MKALDKLKESKSFSDVHPVEKRRWLFGRLRDPTVNLKPSFYKKHRLIVLFCVVIFVVGSAFTASKLLIRAEVANFYAGTCLGTWQTPANAQGQPETEENSTSSQLDASNSAFYEYDDTPEGGQTIFCGSFIPPDFDAKGDVKNVNLNLFWQVGATSGEQQLTDIQQSTVSNQEQLIDSQTPAEAPSSTPSSETTVSPESSFPNPIPAGPEPAPTSTSKAIPINSFSAALFLSDMFSKFVDRVSAQEISSTPPLSDSAPQSGANELIQPSSQDENFAEIGYSTDGQNWISFRKVNSQNWRDLNLNIPLSNWEDLKKLQIQIKILPTFGNVILGIYLDGMLLEINYDLPTIIDEIMSTPSDDSLAPPNAAVGAQATTTQVNVIVLPTGINQPLGAPQGTNFKADESPLFEIDLNALPFSTSTLEQPSTIPPLFPPTDPTNATSSGISSFFKFVYGTLSSTVDFFLRKTGLKLAETSYASGISFPDASNPVVSRIYGPDGKMTPFQPMTVLVNNILRISVPRPGRDFKPGMYELNLWIWKNGSIYYTSGNFSWGVLVVNFNKSIYTSGDEVKIGFGVLDDYGHTICDARIGMAIRTPSGKTLNFSTQNGTIAKNSTCGPITVTNNPDYSAVASSNEVGFYSVKVIAQIKELPENRPREITDSFEVQQQPLFDVERLGPTRIYPPENYRFKLKIKTNQDFSGVIQESVPSSFNVLSDSGYTVADINGEKAILWNVNLESGTSQELYYSFRAPNISPELYKLGPLRIGSWQESRQWQIAADAAGDVILLWDGPSGAIPNGWTCLNCSVGNSFYGVYPRASSTPASASSSRDTFTFAMTFNNASSGTAQAVTTNANTTESVDTHTHTWSNQTATIDIRPNSQNIYFISTASTTTSLPNGIIGMFDVTSTANLPTNWTAYDPLNSSTTLTYLRGGENATSTVGNTTRQVTISQWTSAAGSTSSISTRAPGAVATVGDAGHTHTQLATTTSFGTAVPSAIGVVFAKLSTTSTIPSGIIAMFDNSSLPDNWSSISTSGSAFAGNLIVGTSSYTGTSFGSATFTDSGNFIYTSGVPDTTKTRRSGTGTNLSHQTHTHQVAFTYSITSTSSLPVYKDVILGKYTAPPETISCAVSTSTTSFGTIDSSAVYTSSPNASTSMSCNGGLGCTLYESDVGSSAKPGLYKSAVPTYLIPSPDTALNATATLAAGTDGFGIQATTTTAGSGGTLTLSIRYLQSGNIVGGLTTTTLAVASSTAPVTEREVVITHKAAASSFAIGGSYADTITFSCVSN